jgi:hypothetical protein
MPRYYFHVHNGFGFAPDEEGHVCDTLDSARTLAIAGARELLSAEVCSGQLDLRGRIEIANERHDIVCVVHFKDAVTVRRGSLSGAGQKSRT